MSKILWISDLIDSKSNIKFGYAGIDLETKNIRYFTFYKNGVIYQNQLWEIDYNKLIKIVPEVCDGYPKINFFSEELPKEILSLKKKLLNQHKLFNEQNNLPIEWLNINDSNLSFKYKTKPYSSYSPKYYAINRGAYEGTQNHITLYMHKDIWSSLSLNDKIKFNGLLLHELGHLKATTYSIKNNNFSYKCGLSEFKIPSKIISISNKDDFYLYPNLISYDNSNARLMEEMINDLECKLINPKYEIWYPYGNILNDLCDSKLISARYTINGMDTFYEEMESIIPKENLANELLALIDNSEDEDAKKLILDYQNKKQTYKF